MADVQVKKYKSERAYKKDAPKMAKKGYAVVSVNEQKASLAKKMFAGPMLAKSRWLVTYQKAT